MATRSQNHMWLIGTKISDLSNSNQLPTIKDTLRRLYYSLIDKQMTHTDSYYETIDEILTVWASANISTIQRKSAHDRLKRIHNNYTLIRKNKLRKSANQEKNNNDFKLKIEKLFDVASSDVLEKLLVLEDIYFLEDQRNERNMVMAELDQEFARKVQRKKNIEEASEKRKESSKEDIKLYERAKFLSYENLETDDFSASDSSSNYTAGISKKRKLSTQDKNIN